MANYGLMDEYGDEAVMPADGFSSAFSSPSLSSPYSPPSTSSLPPVPYVGGIVAIEGLSSLEKREAAREAAERANNRPYIQGLAAFVRECWSAAKQARLTSGVDERLLRCLRQRRGEYDPEVVEQIRKSGGSEIYMMLSSNKARAAGAWLRDVMLDATEKAWTIKPTPLPDLPPTVLQSVNNLAQIELQNYMQLTGTTPTPDIQQKIFNFVRDRVIINTKTQAEEMCRRMEQKIEDQLAEGGYYEVMTQFIEDIVTFPSAFVGLFYRKRPALAWENGTLDVQEKITLEFERISPFDVYPAPHATNVDDGYIIIRRRMTRGQLAALRGVEGYNDDAINTVLSEHGRGGLHEWLAVDISKAAAEGKSTAAINTNPEATIDALQFFGSVQGKMLVDWGVPEEDIPDENKEYQCEVWLIGNWVIKAVLNSDKLGRKPIFKASWEEVPGAFWGNGIMDLLRDVQTMCNTVARAMANNVALGSGPQVVFNVDRLPSGEDLTAIYPYKIWTTTSDPFGSSAPPVSFFAPPMFANELMMVYSYFAQLADDITGLPKFMLGDPSGGGALRTSSGIAMLMGNASKGIKQVVGNIDVKIIKPVIERLYYHNMLYDPDPTIKGDVKIIARGAASLVVKEAQQQRVNELLQLALTNPIVHQIVGDEAIAELLRVGARNIDLDTDKLIPPPEVIRARAFQMQQQAAVQQQQAMQLQMALQTAPSRTVETNVGNTKIVEEVPKMLPPEIMNLITQAQNQSQTNQTYGVNQGPKAMSDSGQMTGGVPVTDYFSPRRGV